MKPCSNCSDGRNASSISGILRILCAVFGSAIVLVGCGGQNDVAVATHERVAEPGAQQVMRSTADLRRILLPGMATNEITATFGEPRWKEDLGEGQQVWHYSLPVFPADDAMRGSYVAGVAVGVTNGRLANWGCSYVGAPNDGVSRKQGVLPGSKGQTDSPTLQFFIVGSDRIGDGRFIDTERFPKLGFIAPTPTLAIRRLKEVTLEERTRSDSAGQSRTAWSFGIFLTQEDAARLKTVTATNVSTKLLIMVGDEPVSAPTITAPLETGSLVIECQDRSLMELVKRHLAKMEQKGQ